MHLITCYNIASDKIINFITSVSLKPEYMTTSVVNCTPPTLQKIKLLNYKQSST